MTFDQCLEWLRAEEWSILSDEDGNPIGATCSWPLTEGANFRASFAFPSDKDEDYRSRRVVRAAHEVADTYARYKTDRALRDSLEVAEREHAKVCKRHHCKTPPEMLN